MTFSGHALYIGVALLLRQPCWAQADPMLTPDEHPVVPDDVMDDAAVINDYEALNKALGRDSIRLCQGYACNGWVEDKYPTGQLKHRGFYLDGQLLVYKNFHQAGQLEREFRSIDNFRCVLMTYHPNGNPRTEVKYFKAEALEWKDYYLNGQVRYEQEKHRTEPWYLKMNLYQPDGKPISTMMLVDKKKNEVEQKEYWPNGTIRSMGRVRYDPNRRDCYRVGTWTSYNEAGQPTTDDLYVEGKVNRSTPR
jgi:antitoxin component YwqK of YwqJK toxin-antitoxin module